MKPEFKHGDTVRDRSGKLRKVICVSRCTAYELDGEPGLLYQPDEVQRVSPRKITPKCGTKRRAMKVVSNKVLRKAVSKKAGQP